MKKLLIIITLFISSFFLFFSKEVKASEVTLDISLDLIDDTFLEVKRLSDEFLQNNSDYDNYVIVYKSGYYVHFFSDTSTNNIECGNDSSDVYCIVGKKNWKYKYSTSSSALISQGTSSNFAGYEYDSKFNNLLYSTIPFIYNRGYATDLLYLNYGGMTKTIVYEDTIPLVYDLYLELNSTEQEIPTELESVTNFYTIVIEKISYLAEQVASNYILLSIIVIFILIFVFKLIFGRFL